MMMSVQARRLAMVIAIGQLGVISACRSKAAPVVEDAGPGVGTTASASASPITKMAPLPPDPPPPAAGKVDVTKLSPMSTIVEKNPAMKDIWSPAKRENLNALLTALSAIVETLQADENGTSLVDKATFDRVQSLRLKDALMLLEPHISAAGKLPDDFVASFREHLTAVKGEPHLGTWAPAKAGTTAFDYSALASWLNREDPTYLREHIAARGKGGAGPWGGGKNPVHLFVAWEDRALAWLGMQLKRKGTTLLPAELDRFEQLTSSPLALLRKYDCSAADEVIAITKHNPCTDVLVIDHRTNTQRTKKMGLVLCRGTANNEDAGDELVRSGCKRGGAQDGRGIDFCCPQDAISPDRQE